MDSILSLVSEHDDLFPSSQPSSSSSLSQRRRGSQAALDFFSPAAKRRKSEPPLTQPSASSSSASRRPNAAPGRRPTRTPASASQPTGADSPRSSLSSPELLSFTRPYSIVSVAMRNFMCYTNHTVRLGPHLNMVLGPNGVGKSTIVCAICLGLGGDEKSLGRMPSVSGYIKRQQTQAEVEVELFDGMRARGGSGNLTIRRTLTLDDKSVYHEHTPNGGWRKVTHAHVKELMRACHIQVDNLCVLLAQDRVGKFAELKPTELLLETEKAADVDIFNKHQRLIELRKAERESERGVDTIRGELDGKREEMAAMEPEMKRMEDRKEEEEKMQWMLRRRPWVEYRHEERKAHQAKERKRLMDEQVEKEKETHRPLRRVLERIKREHEEAEAKRQEAEAEAERHKRKRGEAMEALRALSTAVEKKQDEIQRAEDEQDRHEQEVERLEHKVRQQEEKVAALPDDAKTKEEYKQAEAENRELIKGNALLKTDENAVKRAIADLQADVADIDRRRTERLARQSSKADTLFRRIGPNPKPNHKQQYECVQEAKRRQQQYRMKLNTDPTFIHDPEQRQRMNDPREEQYVLKGDVYGPLALEMDFKDDQVAQILEDLIPFSFKLAYIVREMDDWVWMSTKVANIQHRLNETNRKLSPQALAARVPLGQYAQMGVTGYISDVIGAPPLVMHWLCDQFAITTMPFANKEVSAEQLEAFLPKRPPAANEQAIMQLYTPSRKYLVKFSKYGHRDRSMTDTAVAPLRLFSREAGGDEDEEGEHTAEQARSTELRQQMAARQAELAEVAKKQDVMRRRFAQLGELRERYRRALDGNAMERKTLVSWRRELAELQRDSDVEELKRRLTREIDKAQHLQVTRAKELTAAEQKWVVAVARVDVWTVQAQHKQLEKHSVEVEWDKAATKLRQLEADKKRLEKELHDCLVHANRLKAAALRVCREEETVGSDWLSDAVPLDELNERIEMSKAALEAYRRHENQGLVERYERTKQAIDQLTAELDEAERRHSSQATELEKLKTHWLEFIRALVKNVNKSFSAQFRRERWEGEIQLVEHSEFDQFAISILVNFHPDRQGRTQKQQLSAGRQSGGEKSVTTMLYLLCLQSVTDAPFRIVDEINQGMDPVNEEKIFNHIVRASSTMHNVHASIRRQARLAADSEHKADNQHEAEADLAEPDEYKEGVEDGDDNGALAGAADDARSLVSSSSSSHSLSPSPQYILVSPKLLPGLDMPEDVGMRVLVMMGGRMGQQTADRRKQKAGQLTAWEKPEAVVRFADQWMRHRQRSDTDESKAERADADEQYGVDSDYDSETDSSGDEEADSAEAEAESRPAARSVGRGARRSRANGNGEGAEELDMEDVDVLVELEHNWKQSRGRLVNV